MTEADLIRRALVVSQAMASLGGEVFQADGATFARNRSYPEIRDTNHVAHVTASAPGEIDRLLERVEREFAGIGHRRFDLDFTTPPAFEARLAFDGYRHAQDMLVMLLEGELRGSAKANDSRPVEGEAGWAAYAALFDVDWRAYVATHEPPYYGPHDERTARENVETRRLKSPPARFWLAWLDERPVAYLGSWEGREGAGIVDDLFTHPDYRHRGLATALIHRGVADCRSRGAGPVVIVAAPDDTPKNMYAAMGFRPVAIKREYLKEVGE